MGVVRHLKKTGWTIPVAILISWLIAFPEYLLQVPANRIGHISQGGPFTAAQLKIIQEAITLSVFIVFSVLVLKEKPRWNEGVAMALIFAGVLVAMIGRRPLPLHHDTPNHIPTGTHIPSPSDAPTD